MTQIPPKNIFLVEQILQKCPKKLAIFQKILLGFFSNIVIWFCLLFQSFLRQTYFLRLWHKVLHHIKKIFWWSKSESKVASDPWHPNRLLWKRLSKARCPKENIGNPFFVADLNIADWPFSQLITISIQLLCFTSCQDFVRVRTVGHRKSLRHWRCFHRIWDAWAARAKFERFCKRLAQLPPKTGRTHVNHWIDHSREPHESQVRLLSKIISFFRTFLSRFVTFFVCPENPSPVPSRKKNNFVVPVPSVPKNPVPFTSLV